MLADQEELAGPIGGLRKDIHLPDAWRSSFLAFMAKELPKWRDSPDRLEAQAENKLTSQLCAHMNSASRLSQGWDFLQFRVEEPDEIKGGRAIDLIAAPSGAVVWLEGREYSEYSPLMPIECKRLPTPKGPKRDEREYLFSQYSSTGGVDRFKAGFHGAAHSSAAMLAYIQENNIQHWVSQINDWISNLDGDVPGWTLSDKITLNNHDKVNKLARLLSMHARAVNLDDIKLDHLWIEMG